jgi:predicted ATPase
MARLDRLVTAKAIAQYAAVIGRQFSYALLHAVSQLNQKTHSLAQEVSHPFSLALALIFAATLLQLRREA